TSSDSLVDAESAASMSCAAPGLLDHLIDLHVHGRGQHSGLAQEHRRALSQSQKCLILSYEENRVDDEETAQISRAIAKRTRAEMTEGMPAGGGADDRMAGLRATVESHHDRVIMMLRGEVIGHQPLAFISIIRTDYGVTFTHFKIHSTIGPLFFPC